MKKTRCKGDISPPGIQLRLFEVSQSPGSEGVLATSLPNCYTDCLCSSKASPWENSGLSPECNANSLTVTFHTAPENQQAQSSREYVVVLLWQRRSWLPRVCALEWPGSLSLVSCLSGFSCTFFSIGIFKSGCLAKGRWLTCLYCWVLLVTQ